MTFQEECKTCSKLFESKEGSVYCSRGCRPCVPIEEGELKLDTFYYVVEAERGMMKLANAMLDGFERNSVYTVYNFSTVEGDTLQVERDEIFDSLERAVKYIERNFEDEKIYE